MAFVPTISCDSPDDCHAPHDPCKGQIHRARSRPVPLSGSHVNGEGCDTRAVRLQLVDNYIANGP